MWEDGFYLFLEKEVPRWHLQGGGPMTEWMWLYTPSSLYNLRRNGAFSLYPLLPKARVVVIRSKIVTNKNSRNFKEKIWKSTDFKLLFPNISHSRFSTGWRIMLLRNINKRLSLGKGAVTWGEGLRIVLLFILMFAYFLFLYSETICTHCQTVVSNLMRQEARSAKVRTLKSSNISKEWKTSALHWSIWHTKVTRNELILEKSNRCQKF